MKKKPASFHQRILDDVRDNILKGVWLPGQRIPFETDMAQDYGVSRMTVNKVLTQLAREGYLERRRKGGTFVAAPRLQSAVLEIADMKQEVQHAGREHSFVLLRHELREASEVDMHSLTLTGKRPRVLSLLVLHKADGAPYCVEERLINVVAIPEALSADFAVEPAGSWLLQQVPWSSAEHVIRAVAATAADARLLKISAGTPCLEIDRLTQRGGVPLTAVRLCYPGSQHQVVARFMPNS